jgi:hypothetical protein
MKSLKLTIACLGLVFLVTAVADAEAGWLEKPKKQQRTEKTEEQMKPYRPDYFPTMGFVGGVLSRDAHSGWKIGDTPLYLAEDCVITMAGVEGDGWLEEGREATVMGVRMGGAISAHSIVVSDPPYMSLGNASEELKEPGPNPNVGKIVKPLE